MSIKGGKIVRRRLRKVANIDKDKRARFRVKNILF
jgi:hypothetical protein